MENLSSLRCRWEESKKRVCFHERHPPNSSTSTVMFQFSTYNIEKQECCWMGIKLFITKPTSSVQQRPERESLTAVDKKGRLTTRWTTEMTQRNRALSLLKTREKAISQKNFQWRTLPNTFVRPENRREKISKQIKSHEKNSQKELSWGHLRKDAEVPQVFEEFHVLTSRANHSAARKPTSIQPKDRQSTSKYETFHTTPIF